jgi:hypothetical protein
MMVQKFSTTMNGTKKRMGEDGMYRVSVAASLARDIASMAACPPAAAAASIVLRILESVEVGNLLTHSLALWEAKKNYYYSKSK